MVSRCFIPQNYKNTRNCYTSHLDFLKIINVLNTSFLILYEMGMDDKAVRRIMGITQEAIHSTRYRIQQNGRK